MFLERNPDLTARARELRKNMTPWEKKLWYQFLRSAPARFQRQKPIGNYIVDFYCAAQKLAIELDGGQHYEMEAMRRDRYRSKELERLGVTVLRFSNLEIQENFPEVCGTILRYISFSGEDPLNKKQKEGNS